MKTNDSELHRSGSALPMLYIRNYPLCQMHSDTSLCVDFSLIAMGGNTQIILHLHIFSCLLKPMFANKHLTESTARRSVMTMHPLVGQV